MGKPRRYRGDDLQTAIERDTAFLEAHGYDGLVWLGPGTEGCGCGIGDLRPCGQTQTPCHTAVEREGLFYRSIKRQRTAPAPQQDEDK